MTAGEGRSVVCNCRRQSGFERAERQKINNAPERDGATTMKRTLRGIFLLVLVCGSANAALISRLSGQAYYDDVLNITWLADANAGAGSPYDDGSITTDGRMTWTAAQAFIASLNAANYLGVSNWRLPTVTDTGTPGCNSAYTGTDCGYNVDLTTGEMAHLFYSTLGNSAGFNTSGVLQPCVTAGSPYCLTNAGPFSNLKSDDGYWSGTEYAPNTSIAWYFGFAGGNQGFGSKTVNFYAWAVRPDDIAPIPVPAVAWLFGGAFAVAGAVRRRVVATGA